MYGYGNVRSTFSYAATARNIGAFVDDSIRLGSRATLNVGVRIDHSNAFSPAQDELDDLGSRRARHFRMRISSRGRACRRVLGLNLKLTGDGKTVLKAHWGRYHPQVTTGEFANIIGPNVKPYFRGPTTPRPARSGPVPESSCENLSVAADYRSPRTDQFIIGFERELNAKMGLQVNYVRKWGRDFSSWRDFVGTYVPVAGRRQFGPGADR